MEVLDPPALAYGNVLYTATITATYTVSDSNDPAVVTPLVLELLPSGAQQDVEFPRPNMPLSGRVQYVRNAAAVGGYTLRIRAGTSASATLGTIATMQPGESGLCVYWQDPADSIWKLRYFSLAFNAAITVGTLTEGVTFAAGITKMLDASACATGEALIKIPDNKASALDITEAGNSYLKCVSTNAAEAVVVGQPLQALSAAFTGAVTTTDGVASGTARKVGGAAATAVAAVTLTNSAAETSLGTYTIPANTVKAGTSVRVRGYVRVTGNAAADTLTLRVKFGTSTVLQTTALVMIANDIAMVDCVITGRAAPGAAASCAFGGVASWTASGVADLLPAVNAPANQATNGALDVKLTGQWNAASASDIAICEEFIVDVVG